MLVYHGFLPKHTLCFSESSSRFFYCLLSLIYEPIPLLSCKPAIFIIEIVHAYPYSTNTLNTHLKKNPLLRKHLVQKARYFQISLPLGFPMSLNILKVKNISYLYKFMSFIVFLCLVLELKDCCNDTH
jgi:hypothetical protein